MHKIHSSQSAITLTELLITSMLIGIAIIGLISVDTAIRRTQGVSAIRSHNIMLLSTALLRMQNRADEARGLGTATIPTAGAFPDAQIDPVGFIFDNSESISPADTGFCVRILSGDINDFFSASMTCYHHSATGISERIYSLAWALQSTTNICDQCSFVIQEFPGGGQPLNYLSIEIGRRADPSQPLSDLTNPYFSLQTSFAFNKVAR